MQTLPQTDEALAELVSALADGQLQDPELTQALDWLSQSEQGRQQWQAYHVLGDVLRGGRALAPRAEDAFLQRLRDQIQCESLPAHRPAAANDRRFIWRMVAGLAGLVFVSLAAWQVPGWQEKFGAGPLLAQGVPAVPQGGPASAPFAAAQAPGAVASRYAPPTHPPHRRPAWPGHARWPRGGGRDDRVRRRTSAPGLFHVIGEAAEQVMAVLRSGRGLRMVLHGEYRPVLQRNPRI